MDLLMELSRAESPKPATGDTCLCSSANCFEGDRSYEDGSLWGDSDDDTIICFFSNWGLVRGVTCALAYLPEQLIKKMVESNDKIGEFKSLHESALSISTEAALKFFYDDMKRKKASSKTGIPNCDILKPEDRMFLKITLGSFSYFSRILLR